MGDEKYRGEEEDDEEGVMEEEDEDDEEDDNEEDEEDESDGCVWTEHKETDLKGEAWPWMWYPEAKTRFWAHRKTVKRFNSVDSAKAGCIAFNEKVKQGIQKSKDEGRKHVPAYKPEEVCSNIVCYKFDKMSWSGLTCELQRKADLEPAKTGDDCNKFVGCKNPTTYSA